MTSTNRKPLATWSLAGQIVLVLCTVAIVVVVAALLLHHYLVSPWIAGAAALLVTLPPSIWITSRLFNRWSHSIRAVADGIASLRDRDFSVSVTATGPDEIGDLTDEYNSLGDSLRRERLNLYQRELLLDTVVQTTPLALVLTNANDAIVFGNIAARQLFRAGRKIEGLKFAEIARWTRRSRCAMRSRAGWTRSSRCPKVPRRKSFTSATGRSR